MVEKSSNGNSVGRGRKPAVNAAEDPYKLVMATYELPVGLRELSKRKVQKFGEQTSSQSTISAYIRGCLTELFAVQEPFSDKSTAWKKINRRLKAGSQESIEKFLRERFNES